MACPEAADISSNELPSNNDVTEGLITWPRRLRSLGAGRLGVLGGILGACRSEGDFVLDVVVPADKAVSEGTYPGYARRRRCLSPQPLVFTGRSVLEGNLVFPVWVDVDVCSSVPVPSSMVQDLPGLGVQAFFNFLVLQRNPSRQCLS